jgi:hypothetical protein
MNKAKKRKCLVHHPEGRVQVYYNLHKKCLSVRHKGIVIAHTREIVLTDAKFHVQPAGREKVLREKRKNVHAYVSGKLTIILDEFGRTAKNIRAFERVLNDSKRVTYNPYKNKTFVDKSNNEIVNSAEVVHIADKVITAGQFD